MTHPAHQGWVERHPLASAVLLAVIPAVVLVGTGPNVTDLELRKVMYAGAGTLVFGGLLGGMLKLVLDEVAANKRRRDDAAGFVTNLLRDLKDVHDRTAKARLLIAAHRSALTYGKEMRALIEARVVLFNVYRALKERADGVSDDTRASVSAAATRMGGYLGALIDEFRDRYKPLADSQRSYEKRATALAESFGKAADSQPPNLPTFVWEGLGQLPRLGDLLDGGSGYSDEFLGPLDDATAALRTELARVLRGDHLD